MTRRHGEALRLTVLAGVLLAACSDPNLRGQQPPGSPTGALPLHPGDAASAATWLAAWQAGLPATVVLRRGEHQGEVQGPYYSRAKVQYPVYQATIVITNRSGHPLETAGALYVVQTATPETAPTGRTPAVPLDVIGGQFRETPVDDYAGVLELRGATVTPGLDLGLVDSVDDDLRRGFFGGAIDLLLASGSMGGNQLVRRLPRQKTFGRANSGDALTIETDDLQMTVRVAAGREGPTVLVSPRLIFRDPQGPETVFRHVATFSKGDEAPSSVSLVAMDETWASAVALDEGQALWKRRLAVEALGAVTSASSTATLLGLADPATHRPRPLREASLIALGGRPEAHPLAITVARDRKEPWQTRRAAINALRQSKDTAPIAALKALLDEPDLRVRSEAVTGLAMLGAKDAVPALLAMLPKRDAAELRSEIAAALAVLSDASSVPTLSALGTKTDGLRRTLIPVLAQLGEPALPTLEAWFAAAMPAPGKKDEDWPVRMDVCNGLRGQTGLASLALLRKGLADSHDWVRSAAIQALAKPLDAEREALLIGLMSDGNPQVARAAMRALGEAGSAAAKSKLLAVLTTTTLPKDVRWAAIDALGGYAEAPVARALAASLTTETDANLRADTYSSLAGQPESLAVIERGLLDATPYAAGRAAWLLRERRGVGACAPTVAALLSTQNVDAADNLVGTLTLPGCRDRQSFDKVVAALGTRDARYDAALIRLLKSWTGQEAGTDKAKWTSAWK